MENWKFRDLWTNRLPAMRRGRSIGSPSRRRPHPDPLPEGEGTENVRLKNKKLLTNCHLEVERNSFRSGSKMNGINSVLRGL